MKWWVIISICLLIIIGCVWWFFIRHSPVKEGFDGSSDVLTDTLHTTTIIGTDTPDSTGKPTYTIFDPTAAYLQADIYSIEYATPLAELYKIENAFTNWIINPSQELPDIPVQDFYRNIANFGVGQSMTSVTKSKANDNTQINNVNNYYSINNPSAYYKSRDLTFMNNYNFTERFKNNPIGFILSGKKPEGKAFINCGYRPLLAEKVPSIPRTVKKDQITLTGYNNRLDRFIIENWRRGDLLLGEPFFVKTPSDRTGYPNDIFSAIFVGGYLSPSLRHNGNVDTSTCFPHRKVPLTSYNGYKVDCSYYKEQEGWIRERDDGQSCYEDHLATCRASGGSLINDSCFNGCGCIKKDAVVRNKDADKMENWNCPAPQDRNMRCAEVQGEDDPSLSRTILSNPKDWKLKSFLLASSRPTASQTLKSNFEAAKAGQRGGQLYTTLSVIGTISDDTKTDVRKSVYYSMFFNFTDTSTTESQICVGSDLSCNLYFFPDLSGMKEFTRNKTTQETEIDTAGVSHNRTRRVRITDEMLKLLPYHTRDYIRRWAKIRRTRITQYYQSKCTVATTDLKSTINTINTDFKRHEGDDFTRTKIVSNSTRGKYPYFISGRKQMTHSVEVREESVKDVYDKISTMNAYCCGITPMPPDIGLYNPVSYSCTTPYTLTFEATPQKSSPSPLPGPRTYVANPPINTRTYNELKGSSISQSTSTNVQTTVSNPNFDIAPKYDLMSGPEVTPPVFIVKTTNMFVPNFVAKSSTNPNTAEGTYTMSFSVPADVLFLKQVGINVTVTSVTQPNTFFQGNVYSYVTTTTATTLTINNISISSIVNDLKLVTATTPPTLINDYYTISYIDNGLTDKKVNNYQTLFPEIINPKGTAPLSTNPVELTFGYDPNSVFSVGTVVTVSDYSNSANYFTGTITTMTNLPSTNPTSTKFTITPRAQTDTNLSIYGSFSVRASYIITKGEGQGAMRFWLSSQEKKQILNMIAQKYYDLSGGQVVMDMILDVYQVGDRIFDVRFSELRRNTPLTENIHLQMTNLYTQHQLYRTYNLSQDQLLQLEASYATKMTELNNNLDRAVDGIAMDCGVSAKYVVIRRSDESQTGIEISQVIVMDNTGDNVAYNSYVTASSTYVYVFENTNQYIYVSAAGSTVADGKIKLSNGSDDPKAPPCPTPSSYVRDSEGVIYVLAPLNPNGDNAKIASIKLNRRQSIVDGSMKQRVAPYFFKSGTADRNEYVKINLGSMTDITNVKIILPLGYTETPEYTVTFENAFEQPVNPAPTQNVLRVTATATVPSATVTTDGVTRPNCTAYANQQIIDFGDNFLRPSKKCEKTDTSIPSCPTKILNPYKVARFYANIKPGYRDGMPYLNLPLLEFTGYTLGTEAALTFNPMYNAGFTLNTASGLGNTNYIPKIKYTVGSTGGTAGQPLVNQNMCTDRQSLINIMRDYQNGMENPTFKQRPDVLAASPKYKFDEGYVYYPDKILSSKEASTGVCAINWEEVEVDPITNIKSPVINRYGLFKYVTNNKNWGAIDSYYDISNSIIYNNLAAYTSGTFRVLYTPTEQPINNPALVSISPAIDLHDILPTETTLDNLGGACPEAQCSDIAVITQLVNSYNDQNPSKKILKITKAVTPIPRRCEYLADILDGTTERQTKITFNVRVSSKSESVSSFDASTTKCSYVLESYDLTGQFIQTNTPTLAYIYNYAHERVSEYTTAINNIYNTLTDYASKLTVAQDASNYIYDTLGAYGQIRDLLGCRENDSGKSCTDLPVMLEFIKAYNAYSIATNNGNRIKTITHAGTSGEENTCDFVVSVAPIASITHTAQGVVSAALSSTETTQMWRAKMIKAPLQCYFTVAPFTSPITASSSSSRSSPLYNYTQETTMDQVLSLLPVAANRTPWVTPTTIETQVEPQIISVTAGSSVTLNVRASLSPPTYTVISRQNVRQTISFTSSNSVESVILNIPGNLAASTVNTIVLVVDTETPGNNFTARIIASNPGQASLTNVSSKNGSFFTPKMYEIRGNLSYPPYIPNTDVTVVDTNNANNSFTATILSYVVPPLGVKNTTITLNNIRNITGTFNISTRYTIRLVPVYNLQNAPSIPLPIETVDFVDCPAVAYKIQPVAPTTLTNTGAFTCTSGTISYRFNKTNGSNSYLTPTIIPAVTATVTNDYSTVLPIGPPIGITNTIMKQLYPSILIGVSPDPPNSGPELVSVGIYDVRINKSDSLQFGDTYKRIEFGKIRDSIRIKSVIDSPIGISKFAFFRINTRTATLMRDCANVARDTWNMQNNSADSVNNKSIMGSITKYLYDETDDSITFLATACDFGIYGPTDIRKYSTSRYFKVVFRQLCGSPTARYTRDAGVYDAQSNLTGNTIMVYSIIDDTEAYTRSNDPKTFTNPVDFINSYTPTSDDPYILRSLFDALKATSKFRHVRLSVSATPTANTSSTEIQKEMAVEITQLNFYQIVANVLNKTPLELKYAKFSRPGFLPIQYYTNTYTDGKYLESSMTRAAVILNPTGSVSFDISGGSFREDTTVPKEVLVYQTEYPANYFVGTLSTILKQTENHITRQYLYNVTVTNISRVVGPANFSQSRFYTIVVNGCSTGYSVVSDEQKIYYENCSLDSPKNYQRLTNTITRNNESITLPCAIGYKISPNSPNQCIAHGNFSALVGKNMNLNPGTPRLKLNIGEQITINFNEDLKIDYYNFMTGSSSTRPTAWLLEGSMSGNDNGWVRIHEVNGYTYSDEAKLQTSSNRPIYSFVETNYFSPFGNRNPVLNPNNESLNSGFILYDFTHDPSTTSLLPITEGFYNPTILEKGHQPKFTRQVPRLDNFFGNPLSMKVPEIASHMPTNQGRRIQFLKFKFTGTRDPNSKFIHMSFLQFTTPLGPLPSIHYKITNPMGIHPFKGTGPDALYDPKRRWVNSNSQPLLVKFITLPAVPIKGFQFSVPQVPQPYEALPSSWTVEASYDGRVWEIYNEESSTNFNSSVSPIYNFVKEI